MRSIPGIRSRIPGASSARMKTMPGGFRTRVRRQPTASAFAAAHRTQLRDVHGRFAGGWGFAWQGLEAFGRSVDQWESDKYQSIDQNAQDLARRMENYAKENASWQDQTGDARRELHAGVTRESENRWTLWLAHGVEYGVWLEVRWGGKYAIIQPTMTAFAPIVARELGGRR